jgi:hypothetical protein
MSDALNGRHVARPRRSGCGCGSGRKRRVEQTMVENVVPAEVADVLQPSQSTAEASEEPVSGQHRPNVNTSEHIGTIPGRSPRKRFTRRNKGKR